MVTKTTMKILTADIEQFMDKSFVEELLAGAEGSAWRDDVVLALEVRKLVEDVKLSGQQAVAAEQQATASRDLVGVTKRYVCLTVVLACAAVVSVVVSTIAIFVR